MTISYKLDEIDLITLHLYIHSKSENVKRRIKRNKLLVVAIYLILGSKLIYDKHFLAGATFLFFALGFFLLYPKYAKYRIKKAVQRNIKEHASGLIGQEGSINFLQDHFLSQAAGSESKFDYKQITVIKEINTHILIQLKSAHHYIIPKDKINNLENLIKRLKEICQDFGLTYDLDLNFKP